MAKLRVEYSLEVEISEPNAWPADYLNDLLDEKKWNTIQDPNSDDQEPYDDLRTMIIEVITIEDIRVENVKIIGDGQVVESGVDW